MKKVILFRSYTAFSATFDRKNRIQVGATTKTTNLPNQARMQSLLLILEIIEALQNKRRGKKLAIAI